jgi:hypothetical protein
MSKLFDFLLHRDRDEPLDQSTLVNLSILALTQIGLNVATVLSAAVIYKWWKELGIPMNWATQALVDFGWQGIFIPVIWIGVTIKALQSPRVADEIRFALVWLGVAIVLFWLFATYHGVVWPFVRVFSH